MSQTEKLFRYVMSLSDQDEIIRRRVNRLISECDALNDYAKMSGAMQDEFCIKARMTRDRGQVLFLG